MYSVSLRDLEFRRKVERRLKDLEVEHIRLGREIEERSDGIRLREKLRDIIYDEIRDLRGILDE